jgi:hypothetical protein
VVIEIDMLVALKKAKPQDSPPAEDLTQRIRRCADQIRRVDDECKAVIEAYIDEQKLSSAGRDLPREVLKMLFIRKYQQPWFGILGLEMEDEANGRRL